MLTAAGREGKTYRHVHLDPFVGVIKAHNHCVNPIIRHDHGARVEEEGYERRGQEA